MDKFKLINELVKALGLTPTGVVRHWNDSGAIKPALFSGSQAKRKKQSKLTPASKPKTAKNNLLCMSEDDIFEALKNIIAEQAGVDEDEILRSSKLVSLGVDSLDFVEITMMVEKLFDISIPDADSRPMKNTYLKRWVFFV